MYRPIKARYVYIRTRYDVLKTKFDKYFKLETLYVQFDFLCYKQKNKNG